jgi:hypothetical protein
MSRRWTNAAFGFAAGSLSYYVVLAFAAGWHFNDLIPGVKCRVPAGRDSSGFVSYYQECYAIDRLSVWHDAVTHARWNHQVQPHIVYLCGILGAAFALWRSEPEDPGTRVSTRRLLLAGTVFWATVLLNLWFSVANLSPRSLDWRPPY